MYEKCQLKITKFYIIFALNNLLLEKKKKTKPKKRIFERKMNPNFMKDKKTNDA